MIKFCCSVAALSVLLSVGTTAQVVPVDPAVTIGHLPNGFTYYIRQNTTPEKGPLCTL